MHPRSLLFLLLWCIGGIEGNAQAPQPSDLKAVTTILYTQQEAWNNADITQFMEGYWEDEQLVFMGAAGPTFGYENVKKRYQKNYATKAQMGELKFTILNVQQPAETVIQMLGKYELKRTVGDASGYFSLLWRKTKKGWKIVSDHTTAANKEK